MAFFTVRRVNGMTASVLNDYHRPAPEVLDDPVRVRPLARIILLMAAVAGFVVATLWVYRSLPSYRVNTAVTTSANRNEALEFGTRLLYEEEAETKLHPTHLQVICPCQGSSLIGIASKAEWSVFVNISLISLASGKVDEFTLTDLSKFCNDVTVCNSSCYDILRVAIPVCDWSSSAYRLVHHIQSPNLLSLGSLVDAIYTQIYLNEKFVKVVDDNQFFRYALQRMVDLARENTSSSDLDFWNVAADIRAEYSVNYALSMHIDWHAYAALCGPRVCTAVTYVSPLRRSLAAAGLMGGYLSFFKLALGSIMWPALLYLFGFPRWSRRKETNQNLAEKPAAAATSTVLPHQSPSV